MEIQIEIQGLDKVQKMLVELPKNVEKEIAGPSGAEVQFLRFFRKSAKLRAPRFSGQLAESIEKAESKRKGDWEVVITSPYAWFQEMGWNAKPITRLTSARSGYLVGDWMDAKGMEGFGFRPRGIPHPFIAPAFESAFNNLPSILQNAVFKAASESVK